MATDPTYGARVYMKQGATEFVIDNGGTLTVAAGAVVNGLTNAIGNLATGTIDLGSHLFNARELSSGDNFASGSTAPTLFFEGVLGKDTTPSFGNVSSGDQTFVLQWASNNTDTIKLPPIALPADFSTAGGVRVDILGESVGTGTASDAIAAIQIRAWCGFGGGDLGSTHANFTSTPSYQTVSLSTGNLATTVLNLTLTAQAHAGRPINVYGLRVRYTRTT